MIDILNELPEGYAQVSSIFDLVKIHPEMYRFHTVLISTRLLLKNSDNKYESYESTEDTQEENIINFIESKRLYMKKND